MPETVLMMSSIGLVTVVSISSTLAPGSIVVTVHTGKSTLGKRSTPSSLYETSPSTTGIATSTQVNTGRLMRAPPLASADSRSVGSLVRTT